MATLNKRALLTGSVGAVDSISTRKTTAFCLEANNQIAARLGGAASLVEAQAVASHGRTLVDKKIGAKVKAARQACAFAQEVISTTRVECQQITKTNALVDIDLIPVDPVVTDAKQVAVGRALRSAQAATLGIAAKTDPESPSPLAAKDGMLEKIYLAAQKQGLLAKITRPYLLMLNKAVTAQEVRKSK